MKKSLTILIVCILGINAIGQTKGNKALKQGINELFEGYAHYNRFIGNVLISKDDKIIYEKSFGYANLEAHKKNNKASIFSIASVTKSFTGVAIMTLVADGKLNLDNPISNYFSDFMPEHSKKITVQQLLNHSSGIQANIGRKDERGEGLMPNENPIVFQDILKQFKDSKLKFEPGTAYEYNNFGYLLLAQIIEKASGQSYASYLEDSIFKPAKMKNTSSAVFKNVNQKAVPYTGLGMDEFKAFEASIHPSWILGAGDLNSTTGDLYKFMSALEHGSLLKAGDEAQLYSRAQSMEMNGMQSGLGWVISEKGGEQWIYHNGLLPGYTSIMGSLPERNIKIIILSNATAVNPNEDFQGETQFVSGEITDKLIDLIQGNAVETPPLPVASNSDDFEDPKHYMLDNDHTVVLKRDSNGYRLEMVGKEPWSVFTYTFSKDARAETKASDIGVFFAEAMKSQEFDGLANYANADMKDFLGTEKGINVLKGMWSNFVEQFGEFKSYNIYNIEGNKVKNVHIRFHFENNDIGIVLSIDTAHSIQGMFNDRDVKTSHINAVNLIPIGDNTFFIDGYKLGGFQDLKVKLEGHDLLLIDKSMTFKAQLKSRF